jgi:hypothetical protein
MNSVDSLKQVEQKIVDLLHMYKDCRTNEERLKLQQLILDCEHTLEKMKELKQSQQSQQSQQSLQND